MRRDRLGFTGSPVLSFLPILPGQILLNNLLYDTSQLAIPTDRVDPEQHSLLDFLTFALMLGIFHAGPSLRPAGSRSPLRPRPLSSSQSVLGAVPSLAAAPAAP